MGILDLAQALLETFDNGIGMKIRVAGSIVEIIEPGEQCCTLDWLEPLKIEKPA